MTRSFQEYQAEKREKDWQDRIKAQKDSMSNAARVSRASEWKRIGNDKFKAGNLLEAQDYYREAVVYVEDLVDARRKERTELLMPLYCNLAQVHLKLGEVAKAEEVAGKAVAVAEVPRNDVPVAMRAKALFRRGLARRGQGKLEEAGADLAAAAGLQPKSEDISAAAAEVRRELAEAARAQRQAMGGFLNKAAASARTEEERRQAAEEKARHAEERRRDRLARAEQRQQMQTAFAKLSKGSMLYEAREQEMEPVRKKEEEKRRALELEQNLTNILDESKGLPKTEDLDNFLEKKKEWSKEQSSELDQKKKILDKQKKEQQWEEDDVWKGQRESHRRRLEEERAKGEAPRGARSFWEAKEVARWCEQRLRERVLAAAADAGEALEPSLVEGVLGESGEGKEWMLKAIVTDVLKLTGDASVVRLNPHKPPLFFYDYFVKLDWEIAVVARGESAYRSADELITVAAKLNDGKAPASVVERRVQAGTFKLKEFSSEEEPEDGLWPLATKVKHRGEAVAPKVDEFCCALRDELRARVQQLLARWAEEYRAHWA